MGDRYPVGINGLRDAVRAGDRDALVAIRDALAQSIESAQANEVAQLARQLVDVLAKIAALPAQKASAVDDLADKRAKRRTSDPSAKGAVERTGSGSTGGKRGAGS